MAHVQITQSTSQGPIKIVVDGVDMSDHVYRDGFGLVFVGPDDEQHLAVRMLVAADVLDIDLPDAVIEATRKSDDRPRHWIDEPGGSCPACEAASRKDADA